MYQMLFLILQEKFNIFKTENVLVLFDFLSSLPHITPGQCQRNIFLLLIFCCAQCGAEYSGWFTLFKGETFFAATLLQVFAALKSAVLSWPIHLHCVCFAYFTDTITERKSYLISSTFCNFLSPTLCSHNTPYLMLCMHTPGKITGL